jgi:hypothetical protein
VKKPILMRLLIVVAFLIATIIVGASLRYRSEKQAEQKRAGGYQTTLLSYSGEFKSGSTRKSVEDYLRAKNTKFQQMCCVDSTEFARRASWDDLVKIGTEGAPWFCSEKNVYVAFQFTDHAQRHGMPKADDLDTLKAVSIYRWLEGCL